LLAASLSACASSKDLGAGKTGKSFTVSGHSYDKVWDAAIAGVNATKGNQKLEVEKVLNITNQDKAAGRIEANTGMSLWSYGEVVGVFIIPPHDAAQHKVEVE